MLPAASTGVSPASCMPEVAWSCRSTMVEGLGFGVQGRKCKDSFSAQESRSSLESLLAEARSTRQRPNTLTQVIAGQCVLRFVLDNKLFSRCPLALGSQEASRLPDQGIPWPIKSKVKYSGQATTGSLDHVSSFFVCPSSLLPSGRAPWADMLGSCRAVATAETCCFRLSGSGREKGLGHNPTI